MEKSISVGGNQMWFMLQEVFDVAMLGVKDTIIWVVFARLIDVGGSKDVHRIEGELMVEVR